MPVTEGKSQLPKPPEPAEGSIKAADVAQAGETTLAEQPELSVKDNTGETGEQPHEKSNEEVAREVIAGHWGRGLRRQNRLKNAGYDPKAIQEEINKLINRS